MAHAIKSSLVKPTVQAEEPYVALQYEPAALTVGNLKQRFVEKVSGLPMSTQRILNRAFQQCDRDYLAAELRTMQTEIIQALEQTGKLNPGVTVVVERATCVNELFGRCTEDWNSMLRNAQGEFSPVSVNMFLGRYAQGLSNVQQREVTTKLFAKDSVEPKEQKRGANESPAVEQSAVQPDPDQPSSILLGKGAIILNKDNELMVKMYDQESLKMQIFYDPLKTGHLSQIPDKVEELIAQAMKFDAVKGKFLALLLREYVKESFCPVWEKTFEKAIREKVKSEQAALAKKYTYVKEFVPHEESIKAHIDFKVRCQLNKEFGSPIDVQYIAAVCAPLLAKVKNEYKPFKNANEIAQFLEKALDLGPQRYTPLSPEDLFALVEEQVKDEPDIHPAATVLRKGIQFVTLPDGRKVYAERPAVVQVNGADASRAQDKPAKPDSKKN